MISAMWTIFDFDSEIGTLHLIRAIRTRHCSNRWDFRLQVENSQSSMIIDNLLWITLLGNTLCGQEAPPVPVAGRELWMGRGMKGNATTHMYFLCRYFAETEGRSNPVPKLSFNWKKNDNNLAVRPTLNTNSFFFF